MKYDFNQYGQYGPVQVKRLEDDIHLMNQYPAKSGWVIILQNRVNLNSVGNTRYSQLLWYDLPTRTLSTDSSKEDAVPFMQYMLPHCGRPGGWMYKK